MTAAPQTLAVDLARPARRVAMHYEVDVDGVRRRVELPFVTAVFADLLGTPAEPPEPVADRRFIEIDGERFDAVMAEMAPRLVIVVPNTLSDESNLAVELNLTCMADFEPEHWMRKLDPVRALLDVRDAAAPAERDAIADLLDRQATLICQHEGFRQLEAAWRGLHRLVMQSETDDSLKILVLSLSKAELAKTLKRYKGTAWDQSPIFKRLWSDGFGSPGADPIGCVVLDFAFDHSAADVEMLGDLSRIGAACHAPMLAAAAPSLMQMDSWLELGRPRDLAKILTTPEYAAWRSLRESEDSRYLVLTLPRYLGRAPHGANAGAAAGYTFREIVDSQRDLLWCNAAYLLAANIHRSFKVHGWCSRIAGLITGGAVEDLPQAWLSAPGSPPRLLCATEVPIDDRREAELAHIGLAPITARGGSGLVVFSALAVLHRPAEYDDPQATANARLAANLPYILGTGRVAHYLKAIARDVLNPLADAERAREWLTNWMADYVDAAPGAPGAFSSPPKPFAAAEFRVEEDPDKPGQFSTKFFLRPGF
jgi:type VI secretion system protein ImpC